MQHDRSKKKQIKNINVDNTHAMTQENNKWGQANFHQ
jgi:hypothetical protein